MATGFYPIIDTPVPEEGFLITPKILGTFFEQTNDENYWFNLTNNNYFSPNNMDIRAKVAKTTLTALQDLDIHIIYNVVSSSSDEATITVGSEYIFDSKTGIYQGTSATYPLLKGENIKLTFVKNSSVTNDRYTHFTIYAKPRKNILRTSHSVKSSYILGNRRAKNLVDNGELYYSLRGWITPNNCTVRFMIDDDGSRFTRVTAATDIVETAPALLAQSFSSSVVANYDLQHTLWISAKVRVHSATPKSSVFFSGVNKASINAEDEISGTVTSREWQTDYIYISTDARPGISSVFSDIFFGFFYAAEGDYFDIKDVFVCDLTELYGLETDPTRSIPDVEWCLNNLVECPKGKELNDTPIVSKKATEIYYIDDNRKVQMLQQFPPSGLENFEYTKNGNYYYISNIKNNTASTVRVPNSSYVIIDSIGGIKNSVYTKHMVVPDKVKFNSGSIANWFVNSKLQTVEFNPSSIINMPNAFYNCRNLTGQPVCGNNVVNFYGAYYSCPNVSGTSSFGERVEDIRFSYYGGTNLSLPAIIPANVTLINGCFKGCNFPSGNFYFYSNKIEGCYNFFNKVKKSATRHNFYYLAETTTAKTIEKNGEDFGIVGGETVTYTDVADGVYANGKVRIGCKYNTSYNIYLYPVNTVEDLDAIRKKNND